MDSVKDHFDEIASDYDYWKKRNWYYYQNLKKIINEFVPVDKTVLEIGCGTGDILASVEPRYGIGADLSPKMIEIAKSKYNGFTNLKFHVSGEIPKRKFDFILMIDVIEHLENRTALFKDLQQYCDLDTRIIILMANPMWEPLLLLLEKLNLKMPEGPHYRISYSDLKKELEELSFVVSEHAYRQLIPSYIKGLSDFINKYFYKIPALNKMGLSEITILTLSQ
jgi:ubiquinone/menaquinone biosynthesis C-methylase UbiE